MDAIAAGKVAKNLKIVGRAAGGLAIVAAVYDISQNGFTISNSLDLAMTGLALSGVGTGIASTYFIANGACMVFLHKDIGQLIGEALK